jgi:hypothetical protein
VGYLSLKTKALNSGHISQRKWSTQGGLRPDEVKITEGVVTAAAGNNETGKEILRLLLEQRPDEVKVTEGSVERRRSAPKSCQAI